MFPDISFSDTVAVFVCILFIFFFTDLCNDADLPEVEILSLIEEQIPKYRLRADTITDFKGYENQDWIQTPVLPLIEDADLTPELIEEVLKYIGKCFTLR